MRHDSEAQRAKQEIEMYSQLKSMIARDGKLILGLVHHFYGPLRELNFILEDPDPSKVHRYLVRINKQDANNKFLVDIHKATGMAVRMMVLNSLDNDTKTTDEIIASMEFKPITVETFEEGEKHILDVVKEHPMSKDPYYFRKGEF
jgi:hypothetical protein